MYDERPAPTRGNRSEAIVRKSSGRLLAPLLLALGAFVGIGSGASSQVVDRTTLTGKIMCGYQGWFCCPGDGNPEWLGWFHWNNPSGNYNVDVWPDTREYDSSDLFARPNTTLLDGSPAKLFSSSRQGATNVQFRWMQENGIDGVFVQRFVCDPNDTGMVTHLDLVLQNEMNAASSYGRVWALEYDISGKADADIYNYLTTDWTHLCNAFDIKNHPRYLYHNGKPVVVIWGFGFNDSSHPGTPATAQSVIAWFKNDGCFVIGGVPGYWRSLSNDSRSGTAWRDVYRAFDGITPWTVGRYSTSSQITSWRSRVSADIADCNTYGPRLYMPTAWPRFGWDNMTNAACGSTKSAPPRGGQHLWDQLYNWKYAGATCQFIAMYDEYDESTAIMKLTDNVPTTGCWYTTEGKGEDWYLRLANWGSKMQRGEIAVSATIPVSSSTSPDDAQIISDTIPTTMVANQEYMVSVTVRNTGETYWNAEVFKLGGVGDSDPFAASRQNLPAGTVVAPNGQYTFTFMMTAPATTGTYTTDWQMVHEIIRWFGGVLTKQITVTSGPDTVASRPVTDFTATAGVNQVTVSWRNSPSPDSTGTMVRYKTTGYPTDPTDGTLLVDEAGAPGASGSHIHGGITTGGTFYYSAFAHDAVPNYAAKSDAFTTVLDVTAPTSSADKASGVYKAPLGVALSADENASIYYTTDGTEPTTSSSIYGSPIGLSSDTTLRFFAVDAAGNAEPTKHNITYRLISSDGSIDYVKTLPKNTAIRLGDKYLYWKSGTTGFIEEPDRTGAIRVNGLGGLALPDPARVCLTGYLRRPSANEYAIDVDMITPSGAMALRPLAMHISQIKPKEMGGYYLRNWGVVKIGSVSGNTFTLIDPTDPAGITVDTSYASGAPVVGGEFVSITGARAFTVTGLPILYALQILHY